MDLYFKDLTPEAQAALLKEAGITSPKEMNWDVFPITELDFENEEDDDNDNGDDDDDDSIVKAMFVSEWEDGSIVETPCMVNLNSREVFDIEIADVDPDANLEAEYVILPDGTKEKLTALFDETELPVDGIYWYYI